MDDVGEVTVNMDDVGEVTVNMDDAGEVTWWLVMQITRQQCLVAMESRGEYINDTEMTELGSSAFTMALGELTMMSQTRKIMEFVLLIDIILQ